MTRIAVLDDYLRCAAAAADWASLGAEIDFFYDTLHQTDALVARLAPYDVLVTMRERTRFPRAVLEKLPISSSSPERAAARPMSIAKPPPSWAFRCA